MRQSVATVALRENSEMSVELRWVERVSKRYGAKCSVWFRVQGTVFDPPSTWGSHIAMVTQLASLIGFADQSPRPMWFPIFWAPRLDESWLLLLRQDGSIQISASWCSAVASAPWHLFEQAARKFITEFCTQADRGQGPRLTGYVVGTLEAISYARAVLSAIADPEQAPQSGGSSRPPTSPDLVKNAWPTKWPAFGHRSSCHRVFGVSEEGILVSTGQGLEVIPFGPLLGLRCSTRGFRVAWRLRERARKLQPDASVRVTLLLAPVYWFQSLSGDPRIEITHEAIRMWPRLKGTGASNRPLWFLEIVGPNLVTRAVARGCRVTVSWDPTGPGEQIAAIS